MVLFSALLSCGRTLGDSHDNSDKKPRKFMKPCFDEDELLNLCTDPIEICHEERADEIKLVRLDGVKVRQSMVIIISEFSRSKLSMDLGTRQGS